MINFHHIFLSNISDGAFAKCESVFTQIGEIIKDKLSSSDTIPYSTTPCASIVVTSHPTVDGWTLLEKLLHARHVLCGAIADVDIDTVRANLCL
jgi:hypothetical protein